MTLSTVLAVAGAGGIGAVSRYLLSSLISRHIHGDFPWATFAINVSGSFVVGLATGLANMHLVGHEWRIVVGTGFLGGFTTFSTASTEAVGLLRSRRRWIAAFYTFGMLAVALGASFLGLMLASART